MIEINDQKINQKMWNARLSSSNYFVIFDYANLFCPLEISVGISAILNLNTKLES